MLNITDRAVEQRITPFLRLAFRPFFSLACLYAIWLIVRWLMTLTGGWTWHGQFSVMAWHSHEFQFGFAMAIVIGFLLTAAQTWTGQRGLHGWPLALLVGFWLLARVGMNLPFAPLLVSLIGDTAVLLMTMLVLGRMILASGKLRNLMFVPVLLVFAGLHVGLLFAAHQQDIALARQLGFAGIWWFTVLISMMGARVIPFFISRRVNADIRREHKAVTLLVQLLLAAIFLLTLIGEQQWLTPLLLVSLPLHIYRLCIWHHRGLWQEPLLWSLWLSYAFLPLAIAVLLLMPEQQSAALHLLSVGFMASMIVAMISRVSLGHTSRPLIVHPVMKLALALMPIAALSRGLFMVIWPEFSFLWLLLSGWCWMAALATFVFIYTPMLLAPRVDGQTG